MYGAQKTLYTMYMRREKDFIVATEFNGLEVGVVV